MCKCDKVQGHKDMRDNFWCHVFHPQRLNWIVCKTICSLASVKMFVNAESCSSVRLSFTFMKGIPCSLDVCPTF